MMTKVCESRPEVKLQKFLLCCSTILNSSSVFHTTLLYSLLFQPHCYCIFHSSPVFCAPHLSSLFSIALCTVSSTISARWQHHSFFYFVGIYLIFSPFSIITLLIVWWFNHFTFPIVRSHCGNAFHQWLQLIHPCPPPPAPHIREQQAFVWCFVPCLFLWVSLVVFQFCSFNSLTFAFLWI